MPILSIGNIISGTGYENLAENAKFGLNYTRWINDLIKKGAAQGYINAIIAKLQTPLFDMWIDKNRPQTNKIISYWNAGYDFNKIMFPIGSPTIDDKDLTEMNVFNFVPKELVGKKFFEYIPIIYKLTKNLGLKEANNFYTRVYNGLNEYYYIEENGMLRGEKYKNNLPLDKNVPTFPNPFIYTLPEVLINITNIDNEIFNNPCDEKKQLLDKQDFFISHGGSGSTVEELKKQLDIKKMLELDYNNCINLTTIPKTPGKPLGPKTPGKPKVSNSTLLGTKKNFLIIGGLIILCLIIKK